MLWDIEWIDAEGASMEQQYGLNRESAEDQVQRWLDELPGSRVYLYRRRGETSVLIQILAANE